MTAHLESQTRQSAEAKAMVSEIIAAYGDEPTFDAESVLDKNPDLQRFPSIVVDLAYEEFCRRSDRGERIDPEDFARRFPAVTDPLLKLLEVHAFLDENPNAFGAATEAGWPEAGDDVADFRLVREIGRGGFSRVFLAQETTLGDREVVLKICSQANEEAARLGQLNHPHIVPVHSVQSDSFPPFTLICMPFLGSSTMADLIQEGPDAQTPPKAIDGGRGTYADFILRKGVELCDALAYAHRRNVWHCDVKPSNVLLATDGRALLLDFNLAMRHDHTSQVIGGTLPYMAPEQLQCVSGDEPSAPSIDHRTDLFAFGVTMFQLLTGRLPYPTEHLDPNRIQAARQLLELQRAQHDWRHELQRVVSPQVARSIAACLAFDPQDRPDSAAAVANDLRQQLGGVARANRWVRAHQGLLSVVAVVLLVAATIFGAWINSRAPAYLRHYQRGRGALEQGDFGLASQWFDSALELRRDFRDALLLRGWSDLLASRQSGDDKPARDRLQQSAYRVFRDAWQQHDCGESAASVAQCLAEMGNFKKAWLHFEIALERGFSTAGVANNVGFCLVRTGQNDGAVQHLSAAIQLDPSLQVAHHNLLELRYNLVRQASTRARLARKNGMEEVASQHESVAAAHRQMAFDQVQLMREFAPPTAELELAAARVFALAIAAERSDRYSNPFDGQNDLLEQLLVASEMAVHLNLPSTGLQELLTILPQLQSVERFQRLLANDQPPGDAKPLSKLVDIFPEVSGRLESFD